MPANPTRLDLKQPDGKKLKAFIRGDEFQGWFETVDGYTIVKNKSTGYFEYATTSPGGRLIPSGKIATAIHAEPESVGSAIPSPEKGLRPPRNIELERSQGEWINGLRRARGKPAADAAPESMSAAPSPTVGGGPPIITGTWSPRPVSGPKKLLLILVNFQDAKLSKGAAAYWSDVVFNPNAPSVTTYYRDNSYGKVTIVPVSHKQPNSPVGTVTVSLAQKNPNYGNDFCYSVESQMVNDALGSAAAYVDFAALDTNGDGIITVDEALIYLVLAGYETAAGSGLSPSIWAHRWSGDNVGVAGKKINNWALNGEMYDATTRMQMGVIAHEMGHAMGGLPDLYDISNTNSGLGPFSVMAGGSWGAKAGEIPSRTPVGMDAWSRQYLGWSTPRYPVNGESLTLVNGLSAKDSAVMLVDPAASTSEYWLVENRPPIGWDAGMVTFLKSFKGGLLIQHIDSNIGTQDANSFNEYANGAHQGNVVVEASTTECDLMKSNDSAGCASILFFSGNSDMFDSTSTPSSSFYSGSPSGLGVTNISAPGLTMTAIAVTKLGVRP